MEQVTSLLSWSFRVTCEKQAINKDKRLSQRLVSAMNDINPGSRDLLLGEG